MSTDWQHQRGVAETSAYHQFLAESNTQAAVQYLARLWDVLLIFSDDKTFFSRQAEEFSGGHSSFQVAPVLGITLNEKTAAKYAIS
jgi:hypothetical protein